jgi:hypothetical protein
MWNLNSQLTVNEQHFVAGLLKVGITSYKLQQTAQSWAAKQGDERIERKKKRKEGTDGKEGKKLCFSNYLW